MAFAIVFIYITVVVIIGFVLNRYLSGRIHKKTAKKLNRSAKGLTTILAYTGTDGNNEFAEQMDKKISKKDKRKKRKFLIRYATVAAILGVIVLFIAIAVEQIWFSQYSALYVVNSIVGNEDDENKDNEIEIEYEDNEENEENTKNNVEVESEALKLVRFAKNEAKLYADGKLGPGGQKYWDWYKKHTGNSMEGQEWCANFVSYCVYESGLANGLGYKVKNATFGSPYKGTGGNIVGCDSWGNYMTSLGWDYHKTDSQLNEWIKRRYHGKYGWYPTSKKYAPKAGDIVIWNNAPVSGQYRGHIGIIEKSKKDKNGNVTVWVIEGNTNAEGGGPSKSKVMHRDFLWKYDEGSTSFDFYSPPYKYTERAYTGKFSMDNYKKEKDGWYSQETIKKMVSDYFRATMGYNDAAVAAILTNVKHESGFKYDQMEYQNTNKAYFSSSRNGEYVIVPTHGGNGNYSIETMEKIKYHKDYMSADTNYYGAGYGLFGISMYDRSQYVHFVEDKKLGDWYGKDSVYAQLEFMRYKLENEYTILKKQLKNANNNVEDCKELAALWCHKYERPAGHWRQSNMDDYSKCTTCKKRGNAATKVYKEVIGG